MKERFGIAALVAAIIWAVVILAASQVFSDTEQYPRLVQTLGGGAAATIILLGGLAAQYKRKS